MDLTSYLMGKKASGGGSSGVQIIFAIDDGNGILDIKPSDMIDDEGNFKNKYFVLRVIDGLTGAITYLPLRLAQIMDTQLGIAFGDGDDYRHNMYLASISEDNYFEYFNSNTGTH